jgi:hypothetical protein
MHRNLGDWFMELKYCILGCIMMILAPEAHAITASFSGGSGGVSCVSTTTFSANDLDSVSLRSVLGEDYLSQTISGSGNLNENHSIGSAQGSYAEVGAKVIDSGKYEYTYTLTPGDQGLV